jgi:hypothetical protein
LYKCANLVKELGFDVIPKTPICVTRCVTIELRVEGVATKQLLKWTLELIWQHLEQLPLDCAQDFAKLEAHFSVNLRKACA